MSVTTFYTQATIDGLTNISADSIDTSILIADSLDLSGNLDCYNINANNIVANDLHLDGTLDIDENIILNTAGSYIEFGDGSIQQTASLAQGVGVVRGYLNAYSNQDQLNLSTTAYNTMSFNNVDSYNQIDISGNTKIVFRKTGAYLIIISVQVKKDDAGDDDVYFWVAKNGTNIADSNTLSTLSKNNDVDLVTINYGGNFVAGDYIEWRWFSADADLYLHYDASTTINGVSLPATPSVILSIEETNSNYNSLGSLDISGNLTVSGDTSFNNLPTCNQYPDASNQLVTKQYVDDEISGGTSALLSSNNTWSGTNFFQKPVTIGNVLSNTGQSFTVQSYEDTDIRSYNKNINLEATNVNVTAELNCGLGVTVAGGVSCASIDCDSAQVNGTITAQRGNFTDNSGNTTLINALSYSNGILYNDVNPLTNEATTGWSYILFTSNGTLTYNGTSTTTTMYYVAIGAGGSSSGADMGLIYSTNGGSAAGAMSGEFKDGSFNSIPNSSIAITIGAAGNAGNGGFWIEPTNYQDATGASNGTNTTTSGSMLSITARCGDRQPTPPATNAHGQDASGAFTSGGNDYGYGNQSGTGSTTRPTSGEFSTTANRCIGGGGCYANQSGYITNYFTSGGAKAYTMQDGRQYVLFGGSSLATVNVEVSTDTSIYRWGHGGDGPSGKFKASGGHNGAKGGPSLFMVYFQSSTTTSVPGYALSTKGMYCSSYVIPNYDSGWFAVANNTDYTKTHNLNLNILYPPIIWFYFTATTTPTAPIYVMYPNGLLNNNTTNYNSGVMKIDPFTDPNVLTFSTEADAVYYATGGTNIRYNSGYMRVIIRY